ncbi:MAG TPA: TMEM175 family protein [Fimbriimonas sp.]|nr:TMEM175 family protein [Fimbriimonas sp.]
MIREGLVREEPLEKDGFLLRGREVSRVEAFSDAVFGFALTLLVVTLDIPKNTEDLMGILRGIPVFAVCFAMLYFLWNCHYVYCRRYGLQDTTVRILTGVLLFTVLLFVYPLKYIFTLFINGFLGMDRSVNNAIHTEFDLEIAFVVYGLGWFVTLALFGCLYIHAGRSRLEPALSATERFLTRSAAVGFFITASLGLVSVALAMSLPGAWKTVAGFLYCLTGAIAKMHAGWERRQFKEKSAAKPPSD